jgi:hypothetical protein
MPGGKLMKLYFVAKNSTSEFVGQWSLDEIVAKLNAFEIRGDYIVTEFTGTPYAELVKHPEVRWEYVSELVGRMCPPAPKKTEPEPGKDSDALFTFASIVIIIVLVLIGGCSMLLRGMRIE